LQKKYSYNKPGKIKQIGRKTSLFQIGLHITELNFFSGGYGGGGGFERGFRGGGFERGYGGGYGGGFGGWWYSLNSQDRRI